MIDRIQADLLASAAIVREMADTLAATTAQAAELLVACLRGGHTVYVCGNGGSASQAQHIAGEFVGRFLFDRGPLPCVALTADTSVLTAVSNDYDFAAVFERQVNALVRKGDVLWALSTSGNSPNVLRAVQAAKGRGARVIGMAGRTGGQLRDLCDVTLCVPADTSPGIQEGHLALLHILCALVEQAMFPGGASPRKG